MARPTIYNPEDIADALEKFIAANDSPLIQQFLVEYDMSKSRFYDLAQHNDRLSDAIKRAINKQEAYIVKNTETGKLNPIFSIFRLKQHQFGWVDKQEVAATNYNYNCDVTAEDLSKKLDDID